MLNKNDLNNLTARAVELKQQINKITNEQINPLENELKDIQDELVGFMAHKNMKHLDTQEGHRFDLVTRTSNTLDKTRLNKVLQGRLDEFYIPKSSVFIKITLTQE